MKLSVIVPAFNEEKRIKACLDSIQTAFENQQTTDLLYEVIVTDNNSTDATAHIAEECGASVVFESINQISRARNAGAEKANGDWFLFIDADSILHTDTLQELTMHLKNPKILGGGCTVRMEPSPWVWRVAEKIWNGYSIIFRMAAGSFIFCRAEAFKACGGFSLKYYAAEELFFSKALKKWGRSHNQRFVILKRKPHVSSGRKFYSYSKWELLCIVFHALLHLTTLFRNRKHLGYFYDGRR
jgi:glycosyltransferase involved in cell wall biosynthesis